MSSSRSELDESDTTHHAQRLKRMLNDTANHAREDAVKVTDPKAQALFETTARVLLGIVKAFDDFEQGRERAWAETAPK